MLRKIIGITGVIVVIGTIVMVALSPRAQGFFPELLDFTKDDPAVESGTVTAPETALETAVEPNAETETVPAAEVDTLLTAE